MTATSTRAPTSSFTLERVQSSEIAEVDALAPVS
jgi:hypothetical protein